MTRYFQGFPQRPFCVIVFKKTSQNVNSKCAWQLIVVVHNNCPKPCENISLEFTSGSFLPTFCLRGTMTSLLPHKHFLKILGNNQHDALFHVFIYFMSLHVSSVTALIIGRSNCINTSSGMISLCKWLLGMPDRHTKQSLTQTNHTRWFIKP